jgi:hypothetical protein
MEMKYRKILGVAAIAGALLSVNATAQTALPVEIVLRLVPSETLAGVPVTVEITMRNAASVQTTVPGTVIAFDVTSDGDTYRTDPPAILDSSESDPENQIALAPNESRSFFFSMGDELVNPMFADSRLSKPGRYTLQAVLPLSGVDTGVELKSNNASLRVNEPVGTDAAVWKRMNELSKGNGWGSDDWARYGIEVAEYAQQKAPESTYAVYSVSWLRNGNPAGRIARLDNALNRSSSAVWKETLRIAEADLYKQLVGQAKASRNIDDAVKYTRLGINLLKVVIADHVTDSGVYEATSRLEIMPSAEGVRQLMGEQ